jgi:exonuclease SbcD
MKLLLAGDIHIGRASSRVPEDYSREVLRASHAWHQIVELAIREDVQVVCLSGDIADQDNQFWEAIGPLEAGIQRLGEADILTVAVTGNHDYEVLVRLADQLPQEHFRLLGRGGRWERYIIESDGRPALGIDGWSFTAQYIHESPLHSYDLPKLQGVPTLGLVHGDLDVSGSDYAPLSLADLHTKGPDAWLLGHIHKPELKPETPWVLYPGSPQALDPGETEAHGAWTVEIKDGVFQQPVQHPLSSVWYGQLSLDITDIETRSALESFLIEAFRTEASRITTQAGPNLIYAGLRVTLEGVSSVDGVQDLLEEIEKMTLPAGKGDLRIERVRDMSVSPKSKRHPDNTAPGALERLARELGITDPSEEVVSLISEAIEVIHATTNVKAFSQLDELTITDEWVRDHLETQARTLYNELLKQQP